MFSFTISPETDTQSRIKGLEIGGVLEITLKEMFIEDNEVEPMGLNLINPGTPAHSPGYPGYSLHRL